MTSPFQQALLALEIAVDALHRLGPSPAAADALAQIDHLGFDTRPTEERYPVDDQKSKSKAAPASHVESIGGRKKPARPKRPARSLFD